MKVKYGPYSPSRIDTGACPKRFYHEYIAKDIGDTSNAASRRGNVIHETFEEITKGWLEEKPLSWKEVEEIIQKKIAEYKVIEEDAIETSFRAADAYMNNAPANLEHITGTEEHLALTWKDGEWVECDWNDPECVVRGKIDLLQIDGTRATIIDHKTQFNYELADTFQMKFYAWMVQKFYPFVTEINTVLHLARPELNFYTSPVRWELNDLSMIESLIMGRIRGIESLEEFPAIPSDHCKYCSLKLDCPVLDEAKKKSIRLNKIKKGPILSASEAQDVAGMVLVMEEALKVLKKNLQTFNKEIGPVVVNGREFGYKASRGWKVKKEKEHDLYDFLEKSGLDPLDVYQPDVKALQKIGRNATKTFNERVKEKFLEEYITTRFGSRKV